MAGHSQYKNIMYRKGAQDQKRGKLFTKATREIMVAVKEGGPELESNVRLRAAVTAARAVNMPRDNIERAIKKAAGGLDDVQYFNMRYEGYGPNGVAIIVEALTDNRNRTAADVRSLFTKYGGNLGESNSVAFQFKHCGEIEFASTVAPYEQFFEAALMQDAQDVNTTATSFIVTTTFDTFNKVNEGLINIYDQPLRCEIVWQPLTTVPVSAQQIDTVMKLLNALEDLDDVQSVHANFEVDSELLTTLAHL